MLVTVRVFARLREIVGKPEFGLELPDGATVRDAWRELARRHAELTTYESTVSCAVNDDYARMTAELQQDDEVAFLPPVSGGSRTTV